MFFFILEKIAWMFCLEKMDEILNDFEIFLRKNVTAMANDEKRKHNAAVVLLFVDWLKI